MAFTASFRENENSIKIHIYGNGVMLHRSGATRAAILLARASVLVAATRGQLNQKRKLEIRSSSHKSLQSPKGP